VGVLIEIEGIDGSGKGTQARRLEERARQAGYRVQLFSFPRYEQTAFGKVVGDFLDGRFGRLDEVDPYVAALFFAGDRLESRTLLQTALQRNDVVLCDRYVFSNVAHQAAKVDQPDGRRRLAEWVERLEFGLFELPRPDLVVLLDVPVETAQELVTAKGQRSYTDRKADLHEADREYLQRVRELYLELAAERREWKRVDCVEGGRLLDVEAVHERVWRVVQTVLRSEASAQQQTTQA